MNRTPLEVAHEIVKDLYEERVIDFVTLREYESLCLSPVRELSAQQIKKIRLNEKVSQTIFAKYLNTTPSTVKQWERGNKHPRGTSLKLLNLVAKRGLNAIA